MPEKIKCSALVWAGSIGWHKQNSCLKTAIVTRDGKPYCKIHDPEYIKAKRAKKQAEYDAHCDKARKERRLAATAFLQCQSINPSNPQAVAESIKGMYAALEFLVDAGTKALEAHGYHGDKIDWEKIISDADKLAREALAHANSNTEGK